LQKPQGIPYNNPMKIGLIGGSGVYQLDGLNVRATRTMETPFGSPSAPLIAGEIEGREVVFLPRHGANHEIPPHRINFRANIAAFQQLGVERIFSIGAVGGLHADWKPGTIVIPDQIIDMTFGARSGTFFDNGSVMHIDFSQPYCPHLRQTILNAARTIEEPAISSGTYICTNGPRLESAAEIKYYAMIGADIVGMTAMPEAALAREAEICYGGLCIVTNPAAGLKDENLTATEVIAAMKNASERLRVLLRATILSLTADRPCSCRTALKNAAV
jgi:5'-methylthioadenosine phosphorylase